MALHSEGEALYISKKSLLLETCIGVVLFACGVFVVGIASERVETWFVWVWGSFWLLISGAITINGLWGLTVSPPRFARLGDDGLQLYREHAPVVPWTQILDAKLGPKKMEDSTRWRKGRRYLFRHPLILRLRDRSAFPTSGLLSRSFPMTTLPDGTMDWMVPLDGCPCNEQDLVSKIQERIQAINPTFQPAPEPTFPVLDTRRLDRPPKPSAMAPLFAILFIGPGLFFAWKGVEAHQRGTASLAWPTAKGTIKDANLYHQRKGSDFEVCFVYSVMGREFTGRRAAYSSMSSDHQSWVDRFKPGASVDVYYNPEDPADSVLIPGQQKSALIITGYSLFFAVLGSVPVFVYFRARKRLAVWLRQNPAEQ